MYMKGFIVNQKLPSEVVYLLQNLIYCFFVVLHLLNINCTRIIRILNLERTCTVNDIAKNKKTFPFNLQVNPLISCEGEKIKICASI